MRYCFSSVIDLYYDRYPRQRTRPAADASGPAADRSAPPSERVRLRRKRERGSYDREAIDAILDEALIAHLGIVDEDGQPFVDPHAARALRRRRLLPRLGGEPHDCARSPRARRSA